MSAMTQAEIVAFFADLNERAKNKGNKGYVPFCRFLDSLFQGRDLSGCFYYTSLHTFCISRFPTYSEGRHKPSLALSVASSTNLLIELRIFTAIKPVVRWTTESSSVRYEFAMEEFDRKYSRFLAIHDESAS